MKGIIDASQAGPSLLQHLKPGLWVFQAAAVVNTLGASWHRRWLGEMLDGMTEAKSKRLQDATVPKREDKDPKTPLTLQKAWGWSKVCLCFLEGLHGLMTPLYLR